MSRVCLLVIAALLVCAHAYDDVPAALQASELEVVAPEGDTATLRCPFHGNPPPKITWRFEGQTINSNAGRYTQTSEGSLVIKPLHRSDSGVYICVVDNGVGLDTQQVQLVVNDPSQGVDCPQFREEYEKALDCEFGIHNWTLDGCNRWKCKKNPCVRVTCSSIERCIPVKRQKPTPHGDWYFGFCKSDADCKPFEMECKKHCDFGIEKTRGADGCDRCKCKQNLCMTISCAEGMRCVLQKSMATNDPDSQFAAECETILKAGACPVEDTSPQYDTCPRECADDADCRGVGKCCRRGCSYLCLAPVTQTINNFFFNLQTIIFSALASVSVAAGSLETSEGSTTTERTTSIIGTSMLDLCSGFQFGCCADNETEASGPDGQGCLCNTTESGCGPHGGSPDAERMPARIAGDENATVTGVLEKPFHVQCQAYGNPPPCVFWYRGHEADVVLYNNTLYEATDNVLLIRRLSIDTLGPYTCRAYNGAGKAASWEVVVQAFKPKGLFSNNKFLVLITTTTPETPIFTASCLENESCMPSTCSTTPHGCCQDDKTPAHGLDFEGCCLLQPFRCCPDNRKPAEGPHLEGCECQYTLYGCCPDNITIAQGPDNLGCGCQYTQHGCCPDRYTAAFGPYNEGCACNTYQFGCCTDGVTIVKGPNQLGCHCRESTFGCCGDGETPAIGPNAAGCDCSSSRHGCCPDGRTIATGPKFLGCIDAPENIQSPCIMNQDAGLCDNFTGMWFYNKTNDECAYFWYGGCDGNDNRFLSEEECANECLRPSSKGQCNLPVDQGSCAGNYSRWGFNSQAHLCEQFIWGGCEGNFNRFSSKPACQMHCVGMQPPQCTQPQEAGNCTEKEALWSFSQSENRCLPFYYSGCGGNDNRFSSREACEQTCPSFHVPNKCTLPFETGKSSNFTERWFYDTTYKGCRPFYYGGSGGNENNFLTEAECNNSCSEIKTTTTSTTTTTTTTTSTTTSTTTTSTTTRPAESQPQPSPEEPEFRLVTPERSEPSLCENSVLPNEPHPTDCRKYYECALSGPTLKSCRPGTMYNDITMICDSSYNVVVIRPECDTTADPVRMPVRIAEDENSVVPGELNQQFYVRCRVHGYPPPCVFWYREDALVLYNDEVYEVRGNDLLIRSLSIDTLGLYTCRAYNGVGKEVSWGVTVRAYKPKGLFYENELLVSRGTVAPRPSTILFTTVETTTTTAIEAARPLIPGSVASLVWRPVSSNPKRRS